MDVTAGRPALFGMNIKLRWDPAYKAAAVYAETVLALKNVGGWWHPAIARGHFQPSAIQKYSYYPRSRLYMIRKAKTRHHQRPLVWSGRFEASALAAKTLKFTGKSKVKMRLSVYGGWNTAKVHTREELFRTTIDEQAHMAMIIRTHLIGFLRAPTSQAALPLQSFQGDMSAAGGA